MNENKKLRGQLRGVFAVLTLIVSTILFFIPVLFIGLLKLIPNLRWKVLCTRMIDAVIVYWSDINNLYIDKTQKIQWEITGEENLRQKDWYLVIANHQSWLDIVVLQRLFNRKIPMIKFFIKDQLKWVPLLGFAWWAMGCPFMKRYSKDYLAKNPHKKGQDLKATRKALDVFKHHPTTIMNFVEGTRFTRQKKTTQQSPYDYLLKPKAGGIGFVISVMGNQIKNILDVTIVYPDQQHSLWDFLCHRISAIKVSIRSIAIPNEFRGDNILNDEKTLEAFRIWLNGHWLEKDRLISQLQNS
ncbi:acyltransferase [Legionella spiritensis]|uniref:Acyltransferase n=1 Tax=Legionella spiritensis TaxID=452 RepID=A0A0W0Z2M9_LEGSP|nr:acyltransferase [Legionella spiritensis]KTD63369.1 acyltransferase [Legionella spiritensis]SNV35283.1 putative acyltransferase [Legionella spiritensis]